MPLSQLIAKWARRRYSDTQKVLALIPAGLLFLLLIPYTLIKPLPRLDALLHMPRLYFGVVNIVIGVVLIVVGVIFAWWSIGSQLFQANGTPLPVMATQRLLVSGVFKRSRNPMTFGTILAYLGISVIVGSISAVAAVLLFAGLLILYIKNVEEKELELRFGEEYLSYKANTPFLFPRIYERKGK
jgi:protein-S-isoprenylcysteine O-methyltransferase Ste14